MIAELSLVGQLPASRHDQVLRILAGLAAMQPHRVLERHALYKPVRLPEEPGSNLRKGGAQTVNVKQNKQSAPPALYITQLVQKLGIEDFGGDGVESVLSADVKDGDEPKWAMVFEDVPDTGDRGVSIRLTNTTDLLSGDPHKAMVAAGPNQFITEYYIEGHRFTHGNITMLIYRLLHQPGSRSPQTSPSTHPPPFPSLALLDLSGTYLLEAKVRVQDSNVAAVMEAAVTELRQFKERMRGCVELIVPERGSRDTRVKWKLPPGVKAVAKMPKV